MTLKCTVRGFLKAFNHVEVSKIEKDGKNDPWAKGRLV